MEFQGDEEIAEIVAVTPVERLLSRLEKGERGRRFCSLLRAHLERHGHPFFTMDFKEPTLGECSGSSMEMLKGFLLQREGSSHRSEQLRVERERATVQLMATLDPVRRMLARWMLALVHHGLVLREDVVYFLGLGLPTVRRFILELGQRLIRRGLIENKEDVFFLTQAELRGALARVTSRETIEDHEAEELRRRIRERRERWDEQTALKPPVLIPSDFRVWGLPMRPYMAQGYRANAGRLLNGVGVSAGTATGPAAVIHSPDDFPRMKAGCILVAPMTTPAWTPLFALAKGVVTDIGGLLSHTSIVAREYGIPAVIGTCVATQRIVDGQSITVDGDRGRVVLGA
jgi:pyruvate,water dikinase